MMVRIETDRLLIREFSLNDASGMFKLDSNPEVHRYLGNKPISTLKQARETINSIIEQYKQYGIGRYAIIDKRTKDFIGWAGLKYEQKLRHPDSYYDLGYRLRQEYWSKGIASEAAIACLDYGFKKLKLKEICAGAHAENLASNKILEKIGLKYIECFEYEGIKVNWYCLKKSQYL